MKLACEGGEVAVLPFDSAASFVEEALETPDSFLDLELARAAGEAGTWPTLREHLSFRLPLVCGGAYVLENLEVFDGAAHLDILGQVRAQMVDLPDGSPIARFEER